MMPAARAIVTPVAQPARCAWALRSPEERAYHDHEWGVPAHDDRALFELLVLEGAQAGLSWTTVLRKRAGYRAAFSDFAIEAVARYTAADEARLLAHQGIVRNRRKISAAIQNARALLALRAEGGSFATYVWRFVGDAPLQHAWETAAQIPAQSPESRALSADLRRRGFAFVGPTICYAFMQAAGMVNDHLVGCFRWGELRDAPELPQR